MPIYAAIDLKSFYASAECVERGYDPLNTNLVVADQSRTEKTICHAVSPSLKAIGVPGRPRLFEVIQKVTQKNERRQMPLADRAAQFSAFAALTGYDEEIDETARLTDTREAMSEDDIAELDAAFQRLLSMESEQPTVVN